MNFYKLLPFKGIETAFKKNNDAVGVPSVIGLILSLILLGGIIINLPTDLMVYRALLCSYLLSLSASFYYWKEI